MTIKITIANQKGGAGKTSFAVLMCLALAEQGKKVLAIDCDPQGGMSEFLTDCKIDGFIKDLFMNNHVLPIASKIDNIHLYPSDYQLDKLYVTLDHLAFKRTLKNIEQDYDYIIFDTPPTMQGITRAAIHYSDKIFVPSEVSKNAINPTLYTLKCLEELDKTGKVVFVDNFNGSTSMYKNALFYFYKEKLRDNFAGCIKRNDTTKKIVSGEIKLTDSKIEEYLKPILEILEG